MKRILTIIGVIVVLLYVPLSAQELACNVNVVTSKLQGTNKEVFNTLQESLTDFLNGRSWTNHVYEANERIECNILINITEEVSADEYKGTLQVQARRPVYNTSYNTVLFNYVDNDLEFKYQEFDPIEFSETSYLTNLSSILGFYVYIILGLDYDSFGHNGGDQFFRKAEQVVTNAQNAGYVGWKGTESRNRKNRYWLIENILNSEYQPLRDFNYRYHRQGLDVMEKAIEQGRNEIMECMRLLKKFHDDKPDPFMFYLRVVLDSKADEFVQVFAQAQPEQKTRVYNILKEIDPGGGSKYEKLRQ